MLSLVGQTISHYRVLERLGEGGMGVVYKAEDTRLKRTVALKFLPPALTCDLEAKARLIQEAQAASALQHPNICTIHDIDEAPDGGLFIVMDFYESETLKNRIEAGRLRIQDGMEIALQVAQGLSEAHKAGIVHRDIKPGNILLTKNGVAKIVDFGVAKLSNRTNITKTGSTLGTAAYMSPEQTEGKAVDQRTDIWSLGVVLYEMLIGTRPFKGDYESAVVYSILNAQPDPITSVRTGIPMELERVVNKCLAKDPSDRYQHVDELVVDLRSCMKMRAESRPEIQQPRAASQKKKKILLYGLIGLCIIAVGIFTILKFLPRTNPGLEKSIAVLPFDNLSAEPSYSYFAGGLHDELLTQLSKVSGLTVISRTSVMNYQGKRVPLSQIGEELHIKWIGEGSVQVVGNRLRVNVQLVNATTGAQLWADTYDRTLDDAFGVQADVAQQIVRALGGALTKEERGNITAIPTTNPEAYRLYLQGLVYTRQSYRKRDQEMAQIMLERAIQLDSNFAQAHAALSEVHGYMRFDGIDPSPTRTLLQQREAERALQIAPNTPESHVAIGLFYYWAHLDYEAALKEFNAALADLPNDSRLWELIAYVNRRLGNWDEMFRAWNRAVELSPRNPILFLDLGGITRAYLHQYPEALEMFDKSILLAPDSYAAKSEKGWVYLDWRGQLDTLREALGNMPEAADLGDLGSATWMQLTLLLLERNPEALLEMLQRNRESVFQTQRWYLPSSLYAAWAYQLKNDPSSAHAAFQRSLAMLDSALVILTDDHRVHASRGLALAGLGRRAEAIHEADFLKQSESYRRDSYQGLDVAAFRAKILAQAGDSQGAMDEIERLLNGPSSLSVHQLRLDPIWDPLREEPRFKKAVARGQ